MSYPVRFVHVLAMATMLGGAALTWAATERIADEERSALVSVAWTYERAFWVAASVAVATGVGNLGAMAPAVPGPGTGWGLAFAVKLGGVVVLLVGSLFRTAVVWTGRRDPGDPAAPVTPFRTLYAGTTALLVGVVLLAEVIAHG